MRLLLVRHGESKHNVEHFIAQKTCKGLTEHGRQQAEQLAGGYEPSTAIVMYSYRQQ